MEQVHHEPRVCIVGAGVIGLTSALLLREAGYTVSVVARDLPGDLNTRWASPWAGALLTPHPDKEPLDLQATSISKWGALMKQYPDCGIHQVPITEIYDDRSDPAGIWYGHSFYTDFRFTTQDELPSGATLGFTYRGHVLDPSQFLPWISNKLKSLGVSIVRKEVASLPEALRMTESAVVINASGMGAKELASDDTVYPVGGQTLLVTCNPEDESWKRVKTWKGMQYTYAIPRIPSGRIVLGGVRLEQHQQEEADPATRRDILMRVNKMTNGQFASVDTNNPSQWQDITAARPGRRDGIRVEVDGNVVHAYGLDGYGYLFGLGVADRVLQLVGTLIKVSEEARAR